MDLLLTNDDSRDSPLFPFTVEKLKGLGNVTVVAPKEEQSWTGKSMTRFRALSLEEVEDGVYCLDGTPADCVNLGLYHLYQDRPDLVVAGINMGSNSGLGFVLSSGTVGACFEANIAGIPAVALSQRIDREVFVHWLEERRVPEGELRRLCKQSGEVLDRVFETLFERKDFWDCAVTWNVNLPFRTDADWKLVPTFLGHTFYGSCFKQAGDRFQHGIDPPVQDTRDRADGAVVNQGHVSVTRLDIRTFGRLED